MSGTGQVLPPRAAERVLSRCLPKGDVGLSIVGDLRQDYHEFSAHVSARLARRWYWKQVFAIGARYLLAKLGRTPRAPRRLADEWEERSSFIGTVARDIRYAVRMFAKNPGFTLTVIVIVALGVGGTTTIFSVVDAVLLRKLPYPAPHELVFLGNRSHSVPLFEDWRDRTNSFSMIAGAWPGRYDLTNDGTPESVLGARVTADFFSILGARPHRGRLLLAGDDFDATPSRAAVLSYDFWLRRYGGDPSVIGRTITLNGNPAEVVGVLDRRFETPEGLVGRQVDVWLPLDLQWERVRSRGTYVLRVVARLKPDMSRRAAQADVDVLAGSLAKEYPERHIRRDGTILRYPLRTLLEATVGRIDSTLYMLFGAVGLMLLIACANVANLFLARGTDRQREIALRSALGAGRGRIMAQLLTESVLLSLIGGAMGVGVAFAGVHAFGLYNPGGIPRAANIAVDLRALAFTGLVSAATGVLFGMVPAIRAVRSQLNDALKDSVQATTATGRRLKLRSAFVIVQIATALMLLVGAGLLFNSFVHLRTVDPGFRAEGVTAVSLSLGPRFSAEERLRLVRDLVERIGAIPGVDRVGAGSTVPFVHRGGVCCSSDLIYSDPEAENSPIAIIHPITTGYFAALGVNVLRGREFTRSDDDPAVTSTIINEALAHELFGDDDPLGRSVQFADLTWTVVGIVDDIRHWTLQQAGEGNLYVPHANFGGQFDMVQLAVRSRLEPTVLADMLRQAVWAIDGDLPIREITTLEQSIARSIAQPRFYWLLLTSFASIAILLAAGGIYGSMLYSVGRRHKELGIRMALGANRAKVVAMIVWSGLSLTAAGIALGIGGAFALSRTLGSFVFGITTTDPTTFVVVSLLLGTVAMAACYLPARKAAEADPIEILRSE